MEPGEGKDLQYYWAMIRRVLRRRPWLSLGIFLGVIVPVAIVALRMEPRYESTGTVWVDEPNINLWQDPRPRSRFPVLMAILKSRSLAVSVVDALPRKVYDELLQINYQSDWTTASANLVRRLLGKPIPELNPREQVISELLKARMQFIPQGDSGIVQVTAAASDPGIAAALVTAYIETLQSKTRFFTREESRAVRELLDGLEKQVGQALRLAEDALVEYQRQKGAVKIDERLTESFEALKRAESSLSGMILSENIAGTRLAAIKGQLEGRPPGKKFTDSIDVPPTLRTLYERWNRAETTVAALSRRYTDAHPQVRAAREEAQQLWPSLEEALRRHLHIAVSQNLTPLERAPLIDQALGLGEEMVRLPAEREALEAQVRTLRGRLGSLSQDQVSFGRRRQAVDNQKALYALLAQKAEQANLRTQEELRNVRVLDPASRSSSPSMWRALRVLLVGLALGFAAATGVPVGLDLLDPTIKTEEEVEAILGWPALGSILRMAPRAALANRERPRALPEGPSSVPGGVA